MPVYNVLASVEAHVQADNREDAYQRLTAALEAAGFTVDYARDADEPDTTFEAGAGTDPDPRFTGEMEI